jgi:glycosyltransferase involved in cell wall biosynthesis
MEIIVVDDCSTCDDPGEVVARLGNGRVRFMRQIQNVGKAENYATGINAAQGRWIHVLHGDDRVQDGYYESMESVITANDEAAAVFCESRYINSEGQVKGRTGKELEESGLLMDFLDRIVIQQRIQTPSIVVRRDVYESIGAFDRRLQLTEDWEMWIRIATCYTFAFNAEAIADYRTYPENSSSRAAITGAMATDLRKLQRIVDTYLPKEVTRRCRSQRNVAIAYSLIHSIPSVIRKGGVSAWLRLCTEILSYSIAPRVVYYLFRFSLRDQFKSSQAIS